MLEIHDISPINAKRLDRAKTPVTGTEEQWDSIIQSETKIQLFGSDGIKYVMEEDLLRSKFGYTPTEASTQCYDMGLYDFKMCAELVGLVTLQVPKDT